MLKEGSDRYLCHSGINLLELLVRHVLEVGANDLDAITGVELLDEDGAKGRTLCEEAWHIHDSSWEKWK
jgi:hypothetical protein